MLGSEGVIKYRSCFVNCISLCRDGEVITVGLVFVGFFLVDRKIVFLEMYSCVPKHPNYITDSFCPAILLLEILCG